MNDTRRQWAFTAAALVVLLMVTSLRNNLLTISVAGVVLGVGLIVLPRERKRGALAVLIAGCAAAAVVAVSASMG